MTAAAETEADAYITATIGTRRICEWTPPLDSVSTLTLPKMPGRGVVYTAQYTELK